MVGDGNILLHRGTLGHRQLYLADHVGVVDADDGLHRGTGVAVYDVFLRQHVGSRNHDGANLAQGEHYHPPLVAALQNEHHGVVLADAERHQVRRSLVRLLLQLGKRRAYLLALVVGPQQGQPVGLFLGPLVHHVVGEVEVLGDNELQVLVVILNRRERRLLQKSIQETHPLPLPAREGSRYSLSFCFLFHIVFVFFCNYAPPCREGLGVGPYSTVKARNFTGLSPTASMPWGLVESK